MNDQIRERQVEHLIHDWRFSDLAVEIAGFLPVGHRTREYLKEMCASHEQVVRERDEAEKLHAARTSELITRLVDAEWEMSEMQEAIREIVAQLGTSDHGFVEISPSFRQLAI